MQKKNIVTIGGGTGSFMLLSGLKNYPFNISAIVAMTDDGGSTGRLRDELGVLPPGDVRQCLVALSEESQIVRDLFNYRFESGDLKGHTVGNLFLSALEKTQGSFSQGLEVAMKVLKIKGEVIPVTNDNVNLYVKLGNDCQLCGEYEITRNQKIISCGLKKIGLKPAAKANERALEVIQKADAIVIGPGNHYCSVVPNLLVKGISESICRSKAKVIYNVNLVNKKGHTDNFDVDDYVASINSFLGKERVDFVIYNCQKPVERLAKKYSNKGEELVAFHKPKMKHRSYKVVHASLLNQKMFNYSKADVLASQRSFIRHDGEKLARLLYMIFALGDYQSIIKEVI